MIAIATARSTGLPRKVTCSGTSNSNRSAPLPGTGDSFSICLSNASTLPVVRGPPGVPVALDGRACGLATGASAAAPHARAPTNLRFLYRLHRRTPPERRPAPFRPVGCMRGLGSAEALLNRSAKA